MTNFATLGSTHHANFANTVRRKIIMQHKRIFVFTFQIIDDLEGEYKDAFMLHYNFPPYSVGEVGMMSGPKRREIGHGKLAKRALNAVIPKEDYPYVLRVVSEITESNGSSSMATVCGASLSLMDAGVPIKEI